MPIVKLDPIKIHSGDVIGNIVADVNNNLDSLVTAINDINGGQGVIGPQGPQGEQGLPGRDGANGKDGKDGKDGVDGRDGKDGQDGAVGPKGEQGIQGHMGPAGKDGVQGAQGPKGDTGAQGIQGLPGKDGTNGKDGVGIVSAVVTNGNLIITKSDGTTVDAGKVISTATTTTTAGGPPVVGSAPNPFAPIVVTAPQGYKAGCIDDGVELTLDTIAVRMNTTSPRSLQFRVTSGTMNVNISGIIYWTNNGNGNIGANYWQTKVLNTTYQQPFGWDFPWANDNAVYNVQDLTNKRYYRITLSIGNGYKGNFVVMERLV